MLERCESTIEIPISLLLFVYVENALNTFSKYKFCDVFSLWFSKMPHRSITHTHTHTHSTLWRNKWKRKHFVSECCVLFIIIFNLLFIFNAWKVENCSNFFFFSSSSSFLWIYSTSSMFIIFSTLCRHIKPKPKWVTWKLFKFTASSVLCIIKTYLNTV